MPYLTKSSGPKTESALIKDKTGVLYGIVIHTDGFNEVTIEVYDNDNPSGLIIIGPWHVTASAQDKTQYFPLFHPINFEKACYVKATSAGTFTYTVFYS